MQQPSRCVLKMWYVCWSRQAGQRKAAEAVQQFVRRSFDVIGGPVEFAIRIDFFFPQPQVLKLEGKGLQHFM